MSIRDQTHLALPHKRAPYRIGQMTPLLETQFRDQIKIRRYFTIDQSNSSLIYDKEIDYKIQLLALLMEILARYGNASLACKQRAVNKNTNFHVADVYLSHFQASKYMLLFRKKGRKKKIK